MVVLWLTVVVEPICVVLEVVERVVVVVVVVVVVIARMI
jgi:hypothetical protein